MKKMVAIMVAVLCTAVVTVQAGEKAKKELTADQQALMTEMLGKYDANKDGRLDKEERGKMSDEDKAKMIKAGLMKDHGQKEEKKSTDTETKPADGAPE